MEVFTCVSTAQEAMLQLISHSTFVVDNALLQLLCAAEVYLHCKQPCQCLLPAAADAGWPDTVYIIDLVAAGMQQHSSSSSSSSEGGGQSSSSSSSSQGSVASDLVSGLAAVFEDPGCTLVVQDASQVCGHAICAQDFYCFGSMPKLLLLTSMLQDACSRAGRHAKMCLHCAARQCNALEWCDVSNHRPALWMRCALWQV
jgi:hypothetical protein